ncbi:MAG TPA: ABC transporter ATP-binding protein [Nitrososphaerales archaeon]|nr:ABC transporter ATP-binding protein [Nitrososphaerales archaeon]
MQLRVERVTKRFGNLVAVDDCSLELQENAVIYGLIGPNGSGKTTLFNLITGYLAPDSGKIYYGNTDITKKSAARISSLGLVRTFQLSRVFSHLTVEQNLEVARRKGIPRSKINEIISQFGLSNVRNVLAGGLSYGQKKLVDLGRALMMDPQLLLLDEPTAGVEPSVINTMIGQIRYARSIGKSVLVIEHNMNVLMSLAEKIFVLNGGKKIVEGSPSEISANQQVIDAYLGRR